nr:hypothetical protein [Tanacetum cinerariifolium]
RGGWWLWLAETGVVVAGIDDDSCGLVGQSGRTRCEQDAVTTITATMVAAVPFVGAVTKGWAIRDGITLLLLHDMEYNDLAFLKLNGGRWSVPDLAGSGGGGVGGRFVDDIEIERHWISLLLFICLPSR